MKQEILKKIAELNNTKQKIKELNTNLLSQTIGQIKNPAMVDMLSPAMQIAYDQADEEQRNLEYKLDHLEEEHHIPGNTRLIETVNALYNLVVKAFADNRPGEAAPILRAMADVVDREIEWKKQ